MLKHKQNGFTLVELLIVIIIIAILAAITVVAYNGIQNRANDAAVQSDVRNYANLITQQQVITGSYPVGGLKYPPNGMDAFAINKGAYSKSVHNFVYCHDVINGVDSFAIGGVSTSNKLFMYTSNGGMSSMARPSWWGAMTTTCPGMLPGAPMANNNWYSYGYNANGDYNNMVK